jgi:hypothetical protein
MKPTYKYIPQDVCFSFSFSLRPLSLVVKITTAPLLPMHFTEQDCLLTARLLAFSSATPFAPRRPLGLLALMASTKRALAPRQPDSTDVWWCSCLEQNADRTEPPSTS